MKRIVIDALVAVGTLILLALSSFLLWLVVRLAPHTAEFYLRPYWEQQLSDIGTVAAFSLVPVLTYISWRTLYRTLIAYDKKERLQ